MHICQNEIIAALALIPGLPLLWAWLQTKVRTWLRARKEAR